MYKKIKIFNPDENDKSEEFVYEIVHDFIYIDDIKENVYIVRIPNDDELDGFGEDKEYLDFDLGNEEFETWIVDYTMSIKEWLEISNNLLKFVNSEVKK